MGARTPEELETLLEDASVAHDVDALRRLFVEGAVVVDGRSSARGIDEVARLVVSDWEAGRRHLAGAECVQARDLALAVADGSIAVMRRGEDRAWRYAIVRR